MTISMDKKYRTRDGRDVRLLCVDGPANDPIVGIVNGNEVAWWNKNGVYGSEPTGLDLIEYHEPDIRTIWVNVYESGKASYFESAMDAIECDDDGSAIAIAQPVTFEVKK